MKNLMWPVVLVFGLGMSGLAQADDAAMAKQLYDQKCASCHGMNGEGVGTFPPLAGKPAPLIVNMFKAYEGNNRVGPMSSMMWAVTREVSGAQVEAIAAYISAVGQADSATGDEAAALDGEGDWKVSRID